MKLRLTLDVEYIPNGVDAQWLKDNLMNVASRAIGEGLLTGDSEAEVETYLIKVTEPKASLKEYLQ